MIVEFKFFYRTSKSLLCLLPALAVVVAAPDVLCGIKEMPDIDIGAQVFDLVFHPSQRVLYAGLLTGHVRAFTLDEHGSHEDAFTVKPSKRSCRGLATNHDGSRIYAVGKGKGLHMIDTALGKLVESRAGAHDTTINRVKQLLPYMLATGDDDGVVKLWDPRQREATRSHNHHFDFISDFHWIEDKKHLVATSGDGTVSVLDVRSKKPTPFAQSEDQEDELLSIAPISGGTKVVIGTQLGVLSIFDRKKGWADCVDRVPGHPHSIDSIVSVPASHTPSGASQTTILTGSSDGMVRAVQLMPTALLGVVADHGEFPVERIALSAWEADEKPWVGSVAHDETIKLTELDLTFKEGQGGKGELGVQDEDHSDDDSDEEETGESSLDLDDDKDSPDQGDSDEEEERNEDVKESDEGDGKNATDSDSSDDESAAAQTLKRKRGKQESDVMKKNKRGKGRNELETGDRNFFADL